jgi:Predicted phosphatases
MSGKIQDDAILTPDAFPQGFKGLVFDIDGVLFDSRDSNMAYYNGIRKAVGLPPLSKEEENFCHMASVHDALETVFPPELRAAAYEACRNINYMEEILPMLRLEPDLIATLAWLQENAIPCGILTNRSTSVMDVLRHFSLEAYFSSVKTAATGRPKPHPDGLLATLDEWQVDARQIAFLGDSQVDQLAAEAANVFFWSYRNPDLQADLHVTSFVGLAHSIRPLVEG